MQRRVLCATVPVLVAGVLFLSSCASREAPPQFIFGLAQVLTIEVNVDLGSQARANAVVRGIVRDSCTRIDSVRQSLEGRIFSLTLTTRRAISADQCRDDEVPFEATVPLVIRGLPPGEYTVTAGSASATVRVPLPKATPSV